MDGAMGPGTGTGGASAPDETAKPEAASGPPDLSRPPEAVAPAAAAAAPSAAPSTPATTASAPAAFEATPVPQVPAPTVPASSGDMAQPSASSASSGSTGGGRARPILMGLLFLVTCLAMVTSVLLVWSHQVVLNTDRYVAIATRVASDPVAIDGASQRIATQIVTAVDLDARLTDALPDRVKPLAPLLSSTIRDSLATQIARGLSTEQFQAAWAAANRVAHENIVKLLRGQTEAVTLEDGTVTLNLLPIVEKILVQLQTAGVIPASVTIPDLSDPTVAQASIDKLSAAIGRPLPADFGQIPLMQAPQLEKAQTLVKVFDIVVVIAVLLTIGLIVLTILLARRRLRMAIALAIGAVVAYALGIWVVGLLESALVSAVAAGDPAVVRTLFADFTEDLTRWLTAIAIGAAVLAAVLYLVSRPAWLVRLLSGRGSDAVAAGGASAA